MKLKEHFLNLSAQWFYAIGILLIGLLAYFSILIKGIPSLITGILSLPDSTPLFLAIVLPLYLAYRFSGWLGTLLSFNATLILFALQLSHRWRLAAGLFGDFLPMGDDSFYYQGARNLLEGGLLSTLGSWRPLFSGTLATLLGLTQQNLQITLAILVLISAIACFLLTREIQRIYGTIAGILTLTLIFFYYRDYIGTLMTENLGLALGVVGLAILLRGTVKHQIDLCLLAIFILTLALNVRSGAYFILPALILWGSWQFRGTSHFSLRFLLGGFSLVLLGFILNSIVFKLIASPDTVLNSNFAYVFYGLVVNGTWTSIFTKHPEFNNLAVVDQSAKIYELAWEAFLANPLNLVKSILRAYKQFFFDGFIFSFFTGIKVGLVLQILSLIGLLNCYRQRQQPVSSLILVLTLGIVLSVPFLPPWDAGIRPYAVTIPIFALYPALGLTWIVQTIKLNDFVQAPEQSQQSRLLVMVGLALAMLTIIGPITTKLLSRPPQLPHVSCPPESQLVYFRKSPGSSLHLVADSALNKTYIPYIRISDFKTQQKKIAQDLRRSPSKVAKELLKLEAGTTLTSKVNLKDGSLLWVVAKSQFMPKELGIVAACGKLTDNAWARGNTASGVSLFYADSFMSSEKFTTKPKAIK